MNVPDGLIVEQFTACAMCPKCGAVDVHWMTPPVYPDAQTQNPGLPWQTTTYTEPYEHADENPQTHTEVPNRDESDETMTTFKPPQIDMELAARTIAQTAPR